MEAKIFVGFLEVPELSHQESVHDPYDDHNIFKGVDITSGFHPFTIPPQDSVVADNELYHGHEPHKVTLATTTISRGSDNSGPVSLLEGVLLSVFGTLLVVFIICQVVLVLRYCSTKRSSWSIGSRRRRKRRNTFNLRKKDNGRLHPLGWPQIYDVVPCKHGLGFAGRTRRALNKLDSTTVVYSDISNASSNITSSGSDGNFTHPTLETATSSGVFVVDPRGSITPKLSEHPRRGSVSSYNDDSVTSSACIAGWPAGAKAKPGNAKSLIHQRPNMAKHAIGVQMQIENPGYETDSSCSKRTQSSSSTRTLSDLSLASIRRPIIADSEFSNTECHDTEDSGGRSSDLSLTSVSSLSAMSSPTSFGRWKDNITARLMGNPRRMRGRPDHSRSSHKH